MIQEALLRYSVSKGNVYPAYLDERDYPWLASLIEVVQSYAGKPRRDLAIRLLEELPVASPLGKRKLAVYVIHRLMKDRADVRIPAKKIRAAVFAAAVIAKNRVEALETAGEDLDLSAQDIDRFLFSDLPMERTIDLLSADMTPQRISNTVNLRLVQALLFRASEVVVEFTGNSRALVRYAKWRGLICTVIADPVAADAKLVISGPFSLFRRTLMYGKALSELVPLLANCNQFRLSATCVLKGQEKPLQLRLETSELVAFGPAPASQFDSKVEQTFAKSFMKLGSVWDLIREPEPISTGTGLIFPDFCLRHRHDPSRKWFLEIVGFWTPEYLSRKLEQIERAGMSNMILCVDEKLGCSENEFLKRTRTIFFQKKIDPAQVLSFVS